MILPQEYNSVRPQKTGLTLQDDYPVDVVLAATRMNQKYTWWELVLLELVSEQKITKEECLSELEAAHCGN